MEGSARKLYILLWTWHYYLDVFMVLIDLALYEYMVYEWVAVLLRKHIFNCIIVWWVFGVIAKFHQHSELLASLKVLAFFSRTYDGFWTLGLDGGAGRGEEAGAFHGWMSLFTYWLQKDLVLAGEQQALEADKALLERPGHRKPNRDFVCIKCLITCNQRIGPEWMKVSCAQCKVEGKQMLQ